MELPPLTDSTKKSMVFLLLVLSAVLLSGLYGIVHDQLTYTISPEYYTKFKFPMFRLEHLDWPERAKAALVGFLATWWMGVPIGFLVGGAGFLQCDPGRMWRVTWQAYGIVVGVTLATGLAGLAYGFHQTAPIDLANYSYWYVPDNVVDLRRYLCVGYMHNASYLGGVLAMGAGVIYQLAARVFSPC